MDAVLFDMDGTLVDSDAAVENAWRRWARRQGLPADDVLRVAHGRWASVTIRELLPDLDDETVEAQARELNGWEADEVASTTAAPGAHELLASLEIPWAIVTGADRNLADARLEAAGITPKLLITADDVRAGKPDPEGFLLAAERLGVDPRNCLVVEDALPGIEAGRRAGAKVAALRGHEADLTIGDLRELIPQLKPWWKDAVGYQVYLPSFQDSDGDGWGDLDGVRERLDYLVDLGVEILWLTPFFVSPMRDHGYDVADYRQVDPRFGGDAALERLLAAAKQRGLKVIGDLVVNHTSDQHEWFREHPDYYIWRDPAAAGGPPNNWLSHFGGPAWTLRDGRYYLHLFRPEQPDLDWRNPAVADEVDAIIEHWLDRGLDGFRIDTAAYLLKDIDLRDNPQLPDGELLPVRGVTPAWRRQDHRHDIHQPDTHEIHRRWRKIADRHDAFLVGEVYELDPVALAEYVRAERLHSSFWFGLVETDEWDADRIRTMLRAAATASPRLSWVQGNHDRRRAATRYGVRRAMLLHALTAFLPGTFWLYQGEELGLTDGVVPADQAADPLAAAGESRDGARTPMPWSPGSGLGFTTGQPWLPDGERTPDDTVAVQEKDGSSPLRTIKRLLAARNGIYGEVEWVDTADDIVMFRRGPVTVVANLGDRPADFPAVDGEVVFETDQKRYSNSRIDRLSARIFLNRDQPITDR